MGLDYLHRCSMQFLGPECIDHSNVTQTGSNSGCSTGSPAPLYS